MDASEPTPSAAAPPVRPTAQRALLRRAISFVALALIGVVAWVLWQVQAPPAPATDIPAELQRLRGDVAAQGRTIEHSHNEIATLRARLDDADKVNASLREQLIALSERMRLSEEALANLADKRLSGHDTMLLDEAQMLLALGAERYDLFRDPAAAIAAYRHADTALAETHDAAFASVRQSIAAEIDALGRLPLDGGGLTALAQLRAQAAALPAARAAPEPAPANASRWSEVFGQFVRVHRGAETQALLARHESGLARTLFALDLREAESALLARDTARYRAALAAAQTELASAFDRSDAAVAAVGTRLDQLGKAELAPPAPQILGSALQELRNLRATHALRSVPQAGAAKPGANPS